MAEHFVCPDCGTEITFKRVTCEWSRFCGGVCAACERCAREWEAADTRELVVAKLRREGDRYVRSEPGSPSVDGLRERVASALHEARRACHRLRKKTEDADYPRSQIAEAQVAFRSLMRHMTAAPKAEPVALPPQTVVAIWKRCDNCDGRGEFDRGASWGAVPCARCEGRGRVLVPYTSEDREAYQAEVERRALVERALHEWEASGTLVEAWAVAGGEGPLPDGLTELVLEVTRDTPAASVPGEALKRWRRRSKAGGVG